MNDEADSTNGQSAERQNESAGWFRRLGKSIAGGPRNRGDILEFLGEASNEGLLDVDALPMIEGVLETADLQARDIMIPRAQMVVLEDDWDLDQVLEAVVESGHSRFPVVGHSRDEITGILLAKDLLRFSRSDAPGFEVAQLLRPAVFVPESKRVNVMLQEFRSGRNHMAIVVDEYGGVAGIVTIEDVIEQIVGEIDDEYDEAEGAMILKQDERRFLVQGLTPIEDFNGYFQADFSDEEFDTVGGLVAHHFGHMPRRGESLRIQKFVFNVQRADSRRVHVLQVTLSQDE
ncbi:MAG: transporter associated domain-containing protein [Algiphilus sp.]|uniref:HlyC/CorC family transporter n=1 Tax=Algiphilus sp. TaxID=1872431 RepID=UPI0032EBA805